MTAVLNISSRRELFVDSYLIDHLDRARQRLHHPQPREVALTCDEPWEAAGPGYPTVFFDEGLYRMYYRARPADAREDTDLYTCYAESEDGINWVKPELGLYDQQGSGRNNAIWKGWLCMDLTPFRDENPDCPADQRYKAVGGLGWAPVNGLWALASPDGIHWRQLMDEPLPLEGKFDSQNVVFWDTFSGVYRAYWRKFRRDDPKVPRGRDVRTAVSEDFVHWSEQKWLDYIPNRSGSPELDETDDPSGDHHQVYSSGILPYPRAPHILLGFPQRYVDRGWTASTDHLPDVQRRRQLAEEVCDSGRPTRGATVVTDVLFMAGRDGETFFVWPEAFVRPGIQRSGNWYYGDAWTAWGLVETPSCDAGAPGELSVYVRESDSIGEDCSDGRLRRHTLRLDGFASVFAPLTGGVMVTKPLQFEGSRLEINFATSAGGRIRVEIQDEAGQAVPGFSMDECHLQYGDQLDRVVAWQGGSDVSPLAGRSVRLLFELKDADLFALQFTS